MTNKVEIQLIGGKFPHLVMSLRKQIYHMSSSLPMKSSISAASAAISLF